MGQPAKKHKRAKPNEFVENPNCPGSFGVGGTVISIDDEPIAVSEMGSIRIFLCKHCDNVHVEAYDHPGGLSFFYSLEATSAETIAKALLNPPLQK